MHIALLASDGLSPTEIARVLFCSRTTVYAVASRFIREGRAVFDDRRRRGPKPLIGKDEGERIERLIEEQSPVEHGWLRSRWSCKLISLQLMSERLASASRESVRRALHRLEYRWCRPRPVGPDKDSPEQIEDKRERLGDVWKMTEEEAAPFFQDVYPSWRRIPRWAFAGCEKGDRDPSRPPAPTARCGFPGRSTSRRDASTG